MLLTRGRLSTQDPVPEVSHVCVRCIPVPVVRQWHGQAAGPHPRTGLRSRPCGRPFVASRAVIPPCFDPVSNVFSGGAQALPRGNPYLEYIPMANQFRAPLGGAIPAAHVGRRRGTGQGHCPHPGVAERAGLTGRAFFLSGQSGTGKTTIGRLIAAEVACDRDIEELDAGPLAVASLREIGASGLLYRAWVRRAAAPSSSTKPTRLRKDVIRQLLVSLERIPGHVAWVFTSTTEGTETLFEDCDDASPLLSRCLRIDLSRRDLARPLCRTGKGHRRARRIGRQAPRALRQAPSGMPEQLPRRPFRLSKLAK